MTELVAAIVGAVVAYVGGWSQQLLRQRRERRSLATVMLQELRTLDVTLRRLYERKSRGRIPSVLIPTMRYRSEALRLFRAETVRELLEITGLVDSILDVQNELQDGVLDPRHPTDTFVKATAFTAVTRISKLKPLLEKEGASEVVWAPVELPDSWNADSPPSLPKTPFLGVSHPKELKR